MIIPLLAGCLVVIIGIGIGHWLKTRDEKIRIGFYRNHFDARMRYERW